MTGFRYSYLIMHMTIVHFVMRLLLLDSSGYQVVGVQVAVNTHGQAFLVACGQTITCLWYTLLKTLVLDVL